MKKGRNTKIEVDKIDAFAMFFCLIGSFVATLITMNLGILGIGIASMNLIILLNIVARQNELIEECRTIRSKEKS